MTSILRLNKIALISAVLLLNVAAASAFDDGFGSAKRIDGKYITAYYSPETDVAGLVRSMNIGPSDRILAGGSLEDGASYEDELGQMLDTLFMQVSNILDMHLYSLKPNVKICRNNASLKDVYRRMFNADLQNKQSFYVYTLNAIYTSEESFKRQIIGHEIAHAIISHYFPTPAPLKIQEVLSMYVEYNLRTREK